MISAGGGGLSCSLPLTFLSLYVPAVTSQPANTDTSDTIENIGKFNDAVADLPCENILGLVIYDLPGRDCAAKASNGELKVGEVDRYKTEYIDGTYTHSHSNQPERTGP